MRLHWQQHSYFNSHISNLETVKTTKRVSRLVLESHAGLRVPALTKHLDGDKTNCAYSNLTWKPAYSMRYLTELNQHAEPYAWDRLAYGKTKKFSSLDIALIRGSTETQETLAKMYGISQVMIHKIRTRKAYQWL